MSPRRFTILLTAATAAAALSWSGLVGFEVRAQDKPVTISRAHEAEFGPTFDEPIFILVLGGDARGTRGSEYGGRPNPANVRMDSIHILAIDPKAKRASLLGIPRDSYVEIPGRGRAKINAAGVFGGADLMVRTVEDLSACRFDYYALTSFKGFERVIDDLGGIAFDVGYRIQDHFADIDLRPGAQRFDGATALGWARSRKARARGDFDRSLEQGNLMKAALAEARARGAKDAGIPLRALATLRRNLRLNIPVEEAFKLGLVMMDISPGNVDNRVLDGAVDTADGASIVRVTDAGRNQLVDICDDGRLGR